MSVTVGIATLGEDPPMLRKVVDAALRSVERTGGEVLVIANGGARVEMPGTRVIHREERGLAFARNLILDEALHDTVLFTDGDCLVPPDWCSTMAAALADHVMVTGPVRMIVEGPVTAFFDYQRLFDSTPAGPAGPPLIITANSGLRRDRLPGGLRFATGFSTAGEDTYFGLQLADAGIDVKYLQGATPIRHALSESITELTNRYLRNARTGPKLFLEYGRGEAAMPDALTFYRRRTSPDFPMERRFAEVADPRARAAFAVFHTILSDLTLVGYLDGLGTLMGHPLVTIDHEGLDAEWARIGTAVDELTVGITADEWANLDIDVRRIGNPVPGQPIQAWVRAALRRNAPAIPTDPTGPVADVLAYAGANRVATFVAYQSLVRGAWAKLRAKTEPVGPDVAERVTRPLGVALSAACDVAELLVAIDNSIERRRALARAAR